MNDIAFWVLQLSMIHFVLLAKIVHIETGFLYGELEGELYVECPPGMKGVEKGDASF